MISNSSLRRLPPVEGTLLSRGVQRGNGKQRWRWRRVHYLKVERNPAVLLPERVGFYIDRNARLGSSRFYHRYYGISLDNNIFIPILICDFIFLFPKSLNFEIPNRKFLDINHSLSGNFFFLILLLILIFCHLIIC